MALLSEPVFPLLFSAWVKQGSLELALLCHIESAWIIVAPLLVLFMTPSNPSSTQEPNYLNFLSACRTQPRWWGRLPTMHTTCGAWSLQHRPKGAELTCADQWTVSLWAQIPVCPSSCHSPETWWGQGSAFSCFVEPHKIYTVCGKKGSHHFTTSDPKKSFFFSFKSSRFSIDF